MKNKILIASIIVLLIIVAVLLNASRSMKSNETPLPQGKLDINAVCEGALAYMTFPDAKSANAFVAECKEGKHPDVIERYKQDMNLGDAALI